MPMLGFGTWQISGEQCRRAVATALGAGYRHLDTAAMYRNEAEVGQALVDSGLARAVGVSNYRIEQVDELIEATGVAPAVNQVRWAPSLHDPAFLAESAERGVVVEGYSPFRSSDLDHQTLVAIADAHQVTPAQVVLRWHLHHNIVVIPKSVTPQRIRANADIFGFSLSEHEVARIDALAG